MDRPSLIVLSSDEQLQQQLLQWTPRDRDIALFEDPAEAIGALRKRRPWLFLADARSWTGPVEGLLRRAREIPEGTEVLLLLGADMDAPPGLAPDLVYRGEIQQPALREQIERLLRLSAVRRDSGLVGRGPAMRELLSTISQVAPLDVPVLIQGESGTGKEVVARALHRNSRREGKPFISINVGSITETLLESEIFGHEKGSFTGAHARHQGVFERAKGGTLFLDEVGEMSPSLQVKLLRVLETREFARVGGSEVLQADVRLLAATHRHLEEEIAAGRFRSDLYYRLKVMKIVIPPLRDRPEDIPLLAEHFLAEANEQHDLGRKGFTRALTERLQAWSWPGNIRELRNVVMSMAVLGEGSFLDLEDMPPELARSNPRSRVPIPHPDWAGQDGGQFESLLRGTLLSMGAELRALRDRVAHLEDRLEEGEGSHPGHGIPAAMEVAAGETPDLASAEKILIARSLRENRGNRRETAAQLGISERTLYRKLKGYGLN